MGMGPGRQQDGVTPSAWPLTAVSRAAPHHREAFSRLPLLWQGSEGTGSLFYLQHLEESHRHHGHEGTGCVSRSGWAVGVPGDSHPRAHAALLEFEGCSSS